MFKILLGASLDLLRPHVALHVVSVSSSMNVSTGSGCHQRGRRPASAQVLPAQNTAFVGAAF